MQAEATGKDWSYWEKFLFSQPYSRRYPLVVYILLVYYPVMGKSIRVDGKRLRQLRVEQALTLRALGEISSVAYDTINQLELERRPAHASTIRKLAKALNIEPRELIKREE